MRKHFCSVFYVTDIGALRCMGKRVTSFTSVVQKYVAESETEPVSTIALTTTKAQILLEFHETHGMRVWEIAAKTPSHQALLAPFPPPSSSCNLSARKNMVAVTFSLFIPQIFFRISVKLFGLLFRLLPMI